MRLYKVNLYVYMYLNSKLWNTDMLYKNLYVMWYMNVLCVSVGFFKLPSKLTINPRI